MSVRLRGVSSSTPVSQMSPRGFDADPLGLAQRGVEPGRGVVLHGERGEVDETGPAVVVEGRP